MKRKKIKKIVTIVFNVILVCLLVFGLVIAFSLMPFKNNYKILSVMSGSMAPTIKIGSLIFVKPASSYNQRDIVSFRPNNAKTNKDIVTHRIYAAETKNNQKLFITKGDANNAPDSDKISEERIIGRYIFAIPVVGYLIGFIKTLPGLVLIIIIPATLIISEEARKIRKEIKRVIKERKENNIIRKAEE